jgi:hypothetical protein
LLGWKSSSGRAGGTCATRGWGARARWTGCGCVLISCFGSGIFEAGDWAGGVCRTRGCGAGVCWTCGVGARATHKLTEKDFCAHGDHHKKPDSWLTKLFCPSAKDFNQSNGWAGKLVHPARSLFYVGFGTGLIVIGGPVAFVERQHPTVAVGNICVDASNSRDELIQRQWCP